MRYIKIFLLIALIGCAQYHTPDRGMWAQYLRGASLTDMTDTARTAKRPVFLGSGGHVLSAEKIPAKLEYGDKQISDNMIAQHYMANLEYALYDALRKPGISVQRAGTDVVVLLVRDALMELNAPELSDTGVDTLKTITKILQEYDATFIEIAGYTDAMRDATAAHALSMDMANRTAVYMSIAGINPVRMFIVGRGASRPIAAQDDIGRLTNRRIELRITPVR